MPLAERHPVLAPAHHEVDVVDAPLEVLDPLEVVRHAVELAGAQHVVPVVAEVGGREHEIGCLCGVDRHECARVLRPVAAVDLHVGRRERDGVGAEAQRVVVDAGRELVGPRAVAPLVAVERAERHVVRHAERLRHPRAVGTDLEAGLLAQLPDAGDARTLLVEEVDHVGVAVAHQPQQVRLRVLTHDALHQRTPPVVGGVVEVDDECAAHVDQQHRVLQDVGDAQHPHPIGQPHPPPVGEHLHAVAVTPEVVGDPAADVVGQKDARLLEQGKRRRIEVIGVAVREPHRAGVAHRMVLGRRDLVGQPPAAEVGAAPDPRVAGQHGAVVVHHDGRVADRLEPQFHAGRLRRRPRSAGSDESGSGGG